MRIEVLNRKKKLLMNNTLNFYRQVIDDAAVTAYQKYVVDWDNFNPAHLSSTQHTTTQEYDALNRIRKALYPEDLNAQRAELLPTYNKAGALRTLKLGATDYVEEIAYNARGQRILMVMNNSIMTRYVYHAQTFRLARTRSEKCSFSGLTYTSTGGECGCFYSGTYFRSSTSSLSVRLSFSVLS